MRRRLRLHAREFVLDRAVDSRQFTEEGVIVEGERVGDLVDHLQPRLPQHVGAPEQQDRAAQLLLDARQLGVVARLPLARVEQGRDFEFPRQRALAAHFGRMRRQHRADQGVVEEVAQRLRVDARFVGAVEGIGERSRTRRRTLEHVLAIAAAVVLILGDVRQVREIAEGPDDGEGLVGVEAVENRPQLTPRRGLVVAVETDRGQPDALDDVEHLAALLLAHGVAENPAEQTDILFQRRVLRVVLAGERARSAGADGLAAFVLLGWVLAFSSEPDMGVLPIGRRGAGQGRRFFAARPRAMQA